MTIWADRFWSKVNKDGVCWLWTAATNPQGYGRFQTGSRTDKSLRTVRAHRAAFFLTHKKWPQPHCLHACDTPLCVNPDHLFEGSHQDNMDDKVAKGRQAVLKGSNNPTSKLTDTQVLEIRRLCAEGIMLQREIAKQFGIDQATVSLIHHRKKWTHLT